MSRNSKLREVAAKLPPINKIGKNGRYLYDRHGQAIKVDHFQTMCDLKNELPQPKYPSIELIKSADERKRLYWDAQHKMEIQIIGRYTQTIQLIVRKRRNHKIAVVLKWTLSAISMLALGTYFYFKYR